MCCCNYIKKCSANNKQFKHNAHSNAIYSQFVQDECLSEYHT